MDRLCQCPLCFEAYETERKPKMLPCGHTICELCVGELRETSCSECGRELGKLDAAAMPTNFALLSENESKLRLREQAEKTIFAISCNVCEAGIKENRYICMQCHNFDLCQDCFTQQRHRLPGHSLLHNPHKEKPDAKFSPLTCGNCRGDMTGQAYRCLKCAYFECRPCHTNSTHPHPTEVLTNDEFHH